MSELLIKKCNTMISYFNEHKLSLNIGKSGYMVINGPESSKAGIQLISGTLSYVCSYVYLGYIIIDTLFKTTAINVSFSKRSNSTIKFLNFCRGNCTAPLYVKFKALYSCVNACYLYGCEVWEDCNLSKLETLHRKVFEQPCLFVSQQRNRIC